MQDDQILNSDNPYPIEPIREVFPTEKYPAQPDFIYPKDFDIKANVAEFSDEMIYKYHDLCHIFWERILKGAEINFSFCELIILHNQLKKEMEKRTLIHFSPINSLDTIIVSQIEMKYYETNVSKTNESNSDKKEATLSFSLPTTKKRQNE